MILVDTSAWIHFFLGKGHCSDQVDDLLATNDLVLCGPVLTELRRGLRSPSERRRLVPLFDGCQLLSQPDRLWEEAGELGYVLARKGVTAGTLDLLIATYALTHGVPVLAADSDFAAMRAAGIPIMTA